MKISKGDPKTMAAPFFRPGARVIDVGCNIGAFTKVARDAGCVVTSFDADQRVVEGCNANGIIPFIYALGAQTQTDVPVYSRDKTAESSLYRDAVLDEKAGEVSRVEMRRMDDMVLEADLIKVDVQGAESDVLDGALRLLQSCPAWVIECWPHGLSKGGSSARRLWEQLTDAGLTVTWASGVVVQRGDLDDWARAASKTSHVNWLATR